MQSEHPHFRTLKAAFPHGILAMSKCGHAVFVMKIGVLKERYGDIEDAGLSNDDIVRHLALVYEHIFTRIDPRDLPGGRIINIIDMNGLNVMDVQGAPDINPLMHDMHACSNVPDLASAPGKSTSIARVRLEGRCGTDLEPSAALLR